MKKITDFIVEKRNYILVVFIVLSGISLFIGTKVPINNDISKYLPIDSETKIGMDIMDKTFEKDKHSNLYIMFDGLDEKEKQKVLKSLSKKKNVSSVDYDESNKYNNKSHTLYILNIDDYSDSKVARRVYESIKEEYKNEEVSFGGSIYNSNKPVISNWILISAVLFAMIILIIMCDSYIEPFLFLFVIGLAIFLNNGTNIMFDSVSHITRSISAILQLALSMDYSIILMNRYTQEKEKYKNNKSAMKEALYNASKSIMSSSFTTVVGLLALVFMSFTIGKDLGFVLAKGVFFSLVSIFLCLPALILLFDKLIQKTRKKKANIKLEWLGRTSYKFRNISLIIFIVLFISTYFLKGNLNYLYTGAEQDKISKYFNTNNQMAIIYNNEYEDRIAKYCRNLKNDKVSEVLCYGNTINEELKYNELNAKFTDLGQETQIDEYLIRIVYYYYNNENISNKMTFNEFVTFIENTIYNNKDFTGKVTNEMRESISKLKYFTNLTEINKERSYNDISNILGIDAEQARNLYVLKHSNDVNVRMSSNEFVNFLNKDVFTNDIYGSSIDNATKDDIKTLTPFTDKTVITRKMNAKELSGLFGIEEDKVKQLLLLYYQNHDSGYRVGISDFLIGVDASRDYIPDVDLSDIEIIFKIAKNENNINGTKLNRNELKSYFEGYESLIDLAWLYFKLPIDSTYTPQEFIHMAYDNFATLLPSDLSSQLKIVSLVIDDTLTNNKILYDYQQMASILGLGENDILGLYALVGNFYGYEYKLTPYEFNGLILNNKDNPLLAGNLDETIVNKLSLLNDIMNGVINNKSYSYTELSDLLGINSNDMALLYSLYDISYINRNYAFSLNDFVDFILNDVVNDTRYSSLFDTKSINKLKNINIIMDSSINNVRYSNNELFKILNNLSDGLDQNLVDVVYVYYGSIYQYDNKYLMTVESFVNYLNEEIIDSKLFKEFISNDYRTRIKEAKKSVDEAKKLLVGDGYSRAIINTTFELENDETFKFIKSIEDNLNSKGKEIYVIGDSPMAYDMDSSFGRELNFITVLTMLMIFIVVALTFKSIIIPLVLVLIIETAVFMTMSVLSFNGGKIYFIAILIVQSILMGATIDYAIVYTSYYKEFREKQMSIVEALIGAYSSSSHTILTSSLILTIVTFIVGKFAEPIAAKICITISKGTLCSTILILFILPGVLAALDKFILKKQREIE